MCHSRQPKASKNVFWIIASIILALAPTASGSLVVESTVQLTDDPWSQGEPAWGPNGIAYISNGDLWIMNTDGSGKTPLYSPSSREREPAWSLESDKIIFSSDQTSDSATRYYNILVIDVSSRKTELLMVEPVHQRAPSWAPDGRILYLMRGAGNYDIWVCDLDGGNPQQLTSTSSNEGSPSWSPDGKWIAFSLEGDIWLMDADGKNPHMITNDENIQDNPSWSPDGKWITYDSDEEGGSDIWVQNLDEGERIRLTGAEASERNPSWSPDGKWITYESNDGVNTNIMAVQVNIINESKEPPQSTLQNTSQIPQSQEPQQPEQSEQPQQPSKEEKIFGIIPIPNSVKSEYIAIFVVLVILLVFWRLQKKV